MVIGLKKNITASKKSNFNKMKKIIYISILALAVAACGSNKSEVEKIQVEIPEVLTDNKDAKELVEDMTDAVNNCRANMATGAKFAIEQEKKWFGQLNG